MGVRYRFDTEYFPGRVTYARVFAGRAPTVLFLNGDSPEEYEGLSRVNQNVHWMSDVVAGAAIGIYWAHASFQTDVKHTENQARWMPIPFDDGLMISYSLPF